MPGKRPAATETAVAEGVAAGIDTPGLVVQKFVVDLQNKKI